MLLWRKGNKEGQVVHVRNPIVGVPVNKKKAVRSTIY